jgi:hypothetical protein
MSHLGQSRRLDRGPATSGLPQITDIARPARLVRFVPQAEVAAGYLIDASSERLPLEA